MDTKILLIVAVVLVVVVAAFVLLSQPKAATSGQPSAQPPAQPPTGNEPKTASVDIVNFAFQPAEITVTAGTTVTWTNKGSVKHDITSAGIIDHDLNPGETFSFKFDTPGTYDYHCDIHTSMTGKVIVQ